MDGGSTGNVWGNGTRLTGKIWTFTLRRNRSSKRAENRYPRPNGTGKPTLAALAGADLVKHYCLVVRPPAAWVKELGELRKTLVTETRDIMEGEEGMARVPNLAVGPFANDEREDMGVRNSVRPTFQKAGTERFMMK